VTTADLAISEAILGELKAQFPDDQGFSEESTVAAQPVAATARFLLGARSDRRHEQLRCGNPVLRDLPRAAGKRSPGLRRGL